MHRRRAGIAQHRLQRLIGLQNMALARDQADADHAKAHGVFKALGTFAILAFFVIALKYQHADQQRRHQRQPDRERQDLRVSPTRLRPRGVVERADSVDIKMVLARPSRPTPARSS